MFRRVHVPFRRRATASLARCAGHRGIPRPDLGRDQGRPGHGLRHPHRRRDGLAPSLADFLGRRRLRPRGSVVGERRVLPGAARPEPPVQARRCGPLRKSLAALRRYRAARRRAPPAAAAAAVADDAAPRHGRDRAGRPDRPRRRGQPAASAPMPRRSPQPPVPRSPRSAPPAAARVRRRDPRAAPPRRAAADRAARLSQPEVQPGHRAPHGGSRERSLDDRDRARQPEGPPRAGRAAARSSRPAA